MGEPQRVLRGLSDIRTRTSAAGDKRLPHHVHMRLCVLEMERYRRDTERRLALERVAKCESRLKQIDDEARSLLAIVGLEAEIRGGGEAPAPSARPEPPAKTRGGITLQY